MRKERFLPYWDNLERVIPIVQAQTINDITITLICLEVYANHGFLLNLNMDAETHNNVFSRGGRGWTQVYVSNAQGNTYNSVPAMVLGVQSTQLFRGRGTFVLRQQVMGVSDILSITIPIIEWEYTDEQEPAIGIINGPWGFVVSY